MSNASIGLITGLKTCTTQSTGVATRTHILWLISKHQMRVRFTHRTLLGTEHVLCVSLSRFLCGEMSHKL